MTCHQRRHNTAPVLAYSEAGAGETVLLLHGSASTAAIWRRSTGALQSRWRVIMPDLPGYGRSGAWPRATSYSAAVTARALKPLLPCCAKPFHLVGYSFGGVIALELARADPARVATLTLIEPVFFAALRARNDAALGQFQAIAMRFRMAMQQDDRAAALSGFVDFWSGEGAWAKLSDTARLAMLALADQVALDWDAAFAFAPDSRSLEALAGRTTIVSGDRSPGPMLALVDALACLMPGSTRHVIAGANHLLPLTHVDQLTAIVLAGLHAHAERRLP